jgi:hypothetical protein
MLTPSLRDFEKEAAKIMTLSYRGVKYTPVVSAVDLAAEESVGHYRGATYALKRVAQAPAQTLVKGLKYRGVIVR